jgi:hypothetical protein
MFVSVAHESTSNPGGGISVSWEKSSMFATRMKKPPRLINEDIQFRGAPPDGPQDIHYSVKKVN